MDVVIKGLMILESIGYQKMSPTVCDGYVKYEEAEVDRLAIMQNARNNEKKND